MWWNGMGMIFILMSCDRTFFPANPHLSSEFKLLFLQSFHQYGKKSVLVVKNEEGLITVCGAWPY